MFVHTNFRPENTNHWLQIRREFEQGVKIYSQWLQLLIPVRPGVDRKVNAFSIGSFFTCLIRVPRERFVEVVAGLFLGQPYGSLRSSPWRGIGTQVSPCLPSTLLTTTVTIGTSWQSVRQAGHKLGPTDMSTVCLGEIVITSVLLGIHIYLRHRICSER